MSERGKNIGRDRPLAILGGIGARQFLREFWQRRPLLIRGAFPAFQDPLDKKAVLALAMRDDAESRLIANQRGRWEVAHGPLAPRDLTAVKNARWTVLVQDTQHFTRAAHAVLAYFNFIPHARVDDLMVSYAVDGGGVGPHVDSYDVFLLQGAGRRRWRISAQPDLRLKPGMPLKILAHFKPEQEYLLETGDMLYLPPGFAHDGVAVGESLTWSVGFRAPSRQEVSVALLDYLRDEAAFEGVYADPDLTPTWHPGEIDRAMLTRLSRMLKNAQDAARAPDTTRRCLGRLLTEPKPHVIFASPEPLMAPAEFRRAALSRGVELDLKSRLLYQEELFFINGEALEVAPVDAIYLRELADTRALPPKILAHVNQTVAKSLFETLRKSYCEGWLAIA